MTWYGLVDDTTGWLLSISSAEPTAQAGQVVVTFDHRPDFAVEIWDDLTRALKPRPPIVWLDRLDDIETRLMADVDFMAVWNALNQTRRTQLRTGVRRVCAFVLGGARMRTADESEEL